MFVGWKLVKILVSEIVGYDVGLTKMAAAQYCITIDAE